jgi:hypothetical protein
VKILIHGVQVGDGEKKNSGGGNSCGVAHEYPRDKLGLPDWHYAV